MADPAATPEPKDPKAAQRASLIAVVIALLLGAFVAWAGGQGGVVALGVPLFALAVAAAFVAQVLGFIPAILFRTEKHFDLTGALTYLGITAALVLIAPPQDARGWLLAALVAVWAARLGTFLFTRILKAGEDSRFEEIKVDPIRFFRVWILQGLWVSLTAAAAWIVLATDPVARAPFDAWAVAGLLIWLLGFATEAVADAQKSAFRKDPANKGRFITTGLWAVSRHPNYLGEILLWIGVFLIAIPVLQGWQWIAFLSPLFVALLLIRVSGIPLLEKAADAKWGGEPEYEAYKARTPVLIPGVRSSK